MSALSIGMPFGPFHALIAVEMFGILWVFAVLHRKGWVRWKWLFFILANSVIAPLPFYFLISPAFFYGAVPSLLLASCLNAVIAFLLEPVMKRLFQRVVVK